MIKVECIKELNKYKDLIESLERNNYQHTFDNIKAIHKSNKDAKTFIDNNIATTFIPKDDNVIECSLNIEPIIGKYNKEDVLKFLNKISEIENKNLYFSLVYENSFFYKLLKNDLYSYERLYTSIVDTKKVGVTYSNRNINKFEKDLYIKYFSGEDAKKWITDIEKTSWKHDKKQDMIFKKSQLVYYNELIKSGVATIAVAFTKEKDIPVSYRIDSIYDNYICILKNSFKEEYKKASPGSYMLLYNSVNHYKNYKYIDLYGGPSLTKKMISSFDINRYDMFLRKDKIDYIEENRKRWDKKNYDNFIEGKSIKEVFNKKENVLVATSCFGLGPVGKLNAILEAGKDKYNYYASGEEFDKKIFNNITFKDTCHTLDKDKIKEFIDKYNIKYGIVVLKNKMARLLKELGVKVAYVDSLPFMWSKKDAEEGKIPYNVDVYCAQKTIDLNDTSKKLFSKVENLVWVNPIINSKTLNLKKENKIKTILINIGGLHSPSTDGMDYIDTAIMPILMVFKNKRIIITTSSKSLDAVSKKLENYRNVKVKVYKQEEFLKIVKNVQTFFTSPGLTTILEASSIRDNAIFLPPQNISQFYNIEYGKRVFKEYKEITWNDYSLTLEGLKDKLSEDEHGVIEEINKRIKNKKEKIEEYSKYVKNVINEDYIKNKINKDLKYDGAESVIKELDKIIERSKNEDLSSKSNF